MQYLNKPELLGGTLLGVGPHRVLAFILTFWRTFLDSMTYREPLPDSCPPEEAEKIVTSRVVYRLVRNNPPTDADFQSQRAENPWGNFNVSECQARGLSVFESSSDAARLTRKGNLRGRIVCRVTLSPGAGRILKTGTRSHHTWWPYAEYDILVDCQLVSQ